VGVTGAASVARSEASLVWAYPLEAKLRARIVGAQSEGGGVDQLAPDHLLHACMQTRHASQEHVWPSDVAGLKKLAAKAELLNKRDGQHTGHGDCRCVSLQAELTRGVSSAYRSDSSSHLKGHVTWL
jgi:hypothetical protein